MSSVYRSSQTPRVRQTDAGIVPTMPIRRSSRRGGNLLLDLPIAGRLTLGFLLAGLIAALASGIIGVQRSQSLTLQANFYQSLLQTNTSLTTGGNFLQLTNTEVHTLLDVASAPNPSHETLALDEQAISNLTSRYDTILKDYVAHDLVSLHPDQSALLAEAGKSVQVSQQQTLAGSTLRTWLVYKAAQSQLLQDITSNNLLIAQTLERAQGEPTNADAQSALRSLIQFDGRLANSVQTAALVEEQNQLLTTIIGAVIAFMCIGLVGLFISNTLVQRLRHLRQITQTVEQGDIARRAVVVGRDEIADVSASVNAMLETIVGLLEETRNQRDALTNAAEHLFTEMRVVSAGELRVNASVHSDPIGMLANAFNFTIGRFRRFVLRTQSSIEQLDVVARQEQDHATQFLKMAHAQLQELAQPAVAIPVTPIVQHKVSGDLAGNADSTRSKDERLALLAQVRRTQERLQQFGTMQGVQRTQVLPGLTEQAANTLERLNKLIQVELEARGRGASGTLQRTMQELQNVEKLLQRIFAEMQQSQLYTHRLYSTLDTDLNQLNSSIRQISVRETSSPDAGLTNEKSAEFIRVGASFAQEILALSRHLSAIMQELRSNISSFQLDTAENGLDIAATRTPLAQPSLSASEANKDQLTLDQSVQQERQSVRPRSPLRS